MSVRMCLDLDLDLDGSLTGSEGAKQGIYLRLEDPVSLCFKRLDLVMSLHAEAECGGLTGAKRDQGRIQIAIFALKILCLKPADIRRVNSLLPR